MKKLTEIPHVRILGPKRAEDHNGIFTFTMEGVHPHDIAAIMDADGVCIRAGHHCAQPLLKYLRTLSTVRASLAFYNTEEEALRLADIFLRMIKGNASLAEIDELEEASALSDISHMPARVKCAVLGWHTLEEILKK